MAQQKLTAITVSILRDGNEQEISWWAKLGRAEGGEGGVSQESPFLFGPQEPSYYDLDLREEDPGNDLGQLETEP